MPVPPDPADVRDGMPEPSEPDRDVRLGASDVTLVRDSVGQWARCRRDERGQALAEGHDLCGAGGRHCRSVGLACLAVEIPAAEDFLVVLLAGAGDDATLDLDPRAA